MIFYEIADVDKMVILFEIISFPSLIFILSQLAQWKYGSHC